MNTTTKYTINEAAQLYGKSRSTLYKAIKNGDLSRDYDGRLDLSELIRVYGEPYSIQSKKRIQVYPIHSHDTSEYTQNTVQELKNQISFLKQQLEKAEDREAKANARIDTLLILIEMKNPPSESYSVSSSKVEPDPEASERNEEQPSPEQKHEVQSQTNITSYNSMTTHPRSKKRLLWKKLLTSLKTY